MRLILIWLLTTGAIAAEGRWITVEATAYCPCELCCEGSADGITANGTQTADAPHGIAASLGIAMGSRIFVPRGAGYLDVSSPDERVWPVDDRGGALNSEWRRYGVPRIDLRYRSHASALRFGRKLMLVYLMPKERP